MRQKLRWRLLALILFLALTLSFLWCIVDNILASAEMAKTEAMIPVTAVTIAGGMLWLVGHGIHGAAVIALPALCLRRSDARGQIYADWRKRNRSQIAYGLPGRFTRCHTRHSALGNGRPKFYSLVISK